MILELGLIGFSIAAVCSYLFLINKEQGKKSSISAYAKAYKKGWKRILPHSFIVLGLCFPLAFISNNYLTILGASLLFGIGLITGYNDDLWNIFRKKKKELSEEDKEKKKKKYEKLQDILHVGLVNIAIYSMVAGLFLTNWILGLAVIVPFLLTIGIISIKHISRHTYWVEILLIIMMWIFMSINVIL